jgi:hypothetical protein
VVAVSVGWWLREEGIAAREREAAVLAEKSMDELKFLNEMMLQFHEIERKSATSLSGSLQRD